MIKWVVGLVMGIEAAALDVMDLCRDQIEAHQVPIACYQQAQRGPSHELLAVLDRRCRVALLGEQRLAVLKNIAKHPVVTPECRNAATSQLRKLRYRRQDSKPWEVVRSLLNSE